ncbi:MAG: hypothetical protein IPH41_01965 [Sulfuritalea sp.]|jgi:hypothetical protein|nr:hypothetical protein [Sulfuritalea sp.]
MDGFVFTPIGRDAAPEPGAASWQFQPLSEPDTESSGYRFTPLEPERPSVLKTVAMENPATAIGETALNLGTMGVALPIAGLAGIGTAAAKAVGLTDAEPADVVHAIGAALTYQPRGEFGKAATAIATAPFEALARVGTAAGDKVLELTDSPVYATVIDTAINALPMALAPAARGAKAAREKFSNRSRAHAEKATADGTPAAEAQPQAASEAQPQARSQAGSQGDAGTGYKFVPLDEVPNEQITIRNAGGQTPERVQRLAEHEAELSGSSIQELPALRGLRDNDLPGVDTQLRPIPGGRGAEAEPGTLAMSDKYGRELRTGERQMGTEGTADAEAQARSAPRDGWDTPDDTGSRGHRGDSAQDPAMAVEAPRTAHYALVESRDLKPRSFRDAPDRHQQEMSVQAINAEFEPARLLAAPDDATGAPVVLRDGTVEAGQKRAEAIKRVYQANGIKADGYRQHLRENADALGLDPATVDQMKKPVLVRVPDEPAPRRPASADFQEATPEVLNSWAPGANYVPLVDEYRPATIKATSVADLPAPKRRENIIKRFASEIGTTVYEGRIKGEKRLGFFRPKVEEVRTKRANDIEVAAHEVAHLIDFRIPAIANAWRSDKVLREELKSVSYDQKNVKEGFAEGVRLFLTQPETLEAKAPRVHAWLNNFADSHKYGPALRKAQADMTAWFGQDALNRARSKIGTEKPLAEYFDRFWDKFRQATVDDLHGIYRMERDLTGKINPNGPYESARLSRASASIADGSVRFGYPVKQADGSFRFAGKGLEEILQPVSKNIDDALLYFVGKSANELMGQGREHLFTRGEIDGMLRLRTPEREKAFAEYQEWNKGILDFAEAQGIINPEARRLWQRTQYLPFHRVDQPGGIKGKPGDWAGIQALTGGTTNIKDVLGNMIGNAAMLVDKAAKNEARRKIANLSQKEGGGRFMVKIEPGEKIVKVGGDQVIETILKKIGIAIDGDVPAFFEFLIKGQPPAGANVVAVMQGGKPVWFEVGDPVLYRALKAIDRPLMSTVVKVLGWPKRIGQATITATPDFWMANIARDTLMGSVMSRAGFRPILDSLQGMRLRLTKDPIYKDYLANGGGLSSIFLDEHHFRTKLERYYRDQKIDYRTVLDTPDKFLTMLETLGDTFEMSTRLGEYKRAIAAGENPRHAAYLGRDVSTDFAMKGDSKALGFMMDVTMFLRPALVSWDRLYRGLAHDPNKGAIAAKAGMMALFSTALYLLNRDDPRYKDLPDWDRDAHWHFFVGDQHFRWPKIWEIGAMSSAAERSAEKIIAADPQGLGKDFARIIGATFNLNLMPQILAPLYEQAANKNSFTKAPIETPGMENVQPFLRAKPGTSETMKAAGMATRDLPEALQVNPARAEALLRGYFHTYAMYGLMLSDQALFGHTLPEKRADELPVVRRFYQQEPAKHTRHETEFYELLTEAKRLRGTMRELDEMGLRSFADAKEQSPMAGEAKPLERAAKTLGTINNDMQAVRRDQSLTPAEKRLKLDALTVERNALLKDAVQDSRAAQKAKDFTPADIARRGILK